MISPQAQRTQRINFIRISEREILINNICDKINIPCICPKGWADSIFPPLRGKYYKLKTSAFSAASEHSERAVDTYS